MTINNESKNNLAVTNESKGSATVTWNEITGTWDEYPTDTWDSIGTYITKESKNNLTITPESKNP